MTSFIGIQLGKIDSAVAAIDDSGYPYIVHNMEGERFTPSCVMIDDDGGLVVGEEARRIWGVSAGAAAARFQRDMGTSVTFEIKNQSFSPTELSSLVLKKLKQDTENSIGSHCDAVVTIPANFSNEAREATMAAAKEAGLKVQYIINEPTAAALYYAFKNESELYGNYAVYDLGGGTFDVSIIKVNGQDIDVLATNGVSKLGGDDFDDALVGIVAKKYLAASGEEMEPDDYSKNDDEEDKKSLSKRNKVTVKVVRKVFDINRDEFEEAISSRIAQAEMLCEATLDEAELTPSDIRGVFLAGGSTRIPAVQESVKRVFKQEPTSSVNVDEVVALGASLYAAYKGDKSNLSTVQKNAIDKITVLESTSKFFGTLALSFDHEREEQKMKNSIIIRKGEKIPCSVTEEFFTVHDGQTAINCDITESNSPEEDPKFVKVVWEGTLELPPNRPKGQKINITYSYDDNQIMRCSFVDLESKRKLEKDLSIVATEELDENKINKFIVE